MTRILLARHGETEWNARGKLQGRTDVPLNERGQAQARELALRLRGQRVTSVTTSDLSRAIETGSIVARELGLPEPHVDGELRERCFGVFEGLTREECASLHPVAWRAWLDQTSPPEGAEPVREVVDRMNLALTRAALRASTTKAVSGDADGDAPSLVVSHGGVMRLFLQDLLGASVPLIANGAVYRVEHDASGLRAELWTP